MTTDIEVPNSPLKNKQQSSRNPPIDTREAPPTQSSLPPNIVDRADDNFIDAWTQLAELCPKGEVIRQNNLVITNCHMRIPTFNRIFITPNQTINTHTKPSSPNKLLEQLNEATRYFQDQHFALYYRSL